MIPTISPMMTGRGNAVAGAEKVTPARKTIASMPSRRTVMKGSTNMAYFSTKRLNHPFSEVLTRDSIALASLTRHFACILPMRSKAAPIIVITIAANSENAPS